MAPELRQLRRRQFELCNGGAKERTGLPHLSVAVGNEFHELYKYSAHNLDILADHLHTSSSSVGILGV